MKHNVGNADRLIRTIIALVIATLYFMNIISGGWAYFLLAVAGILLLTGFLGTCPLYTLLGINTYTQKHKEDRHH